MSKMNFKSILALMLVICVAFAMVTGCSNASDAEVEGEAVVDEAADETATDAEAVVADEEVVADEDAAADEEVVADEDAAADEAAADEEVTE